MREQVEQVLNKVRPSLMADGGNVELVDVEDGIVKVNYYSAMATGAGNRTYELLRANEEKVLVSRDLWMNSPTFFEDVRRRSVSDTCRKMLGLLGYDGLRDD